MLMGAAGAAGGGPLTVEDVFSTTLYTGTGASSQTVSNGINLSGKGGLVWIKNRGGTDAHALHDTEQGASKVLQSNKVDATLSSTNVLNAFNSDGFAVGPANMTGGNNLNYVSWTFKKAPKFFDVVTYTGNGATSRNIAHSLNSSVGFIIVKRTDGGSTNWFTLHRSWSYNGGSGSNSADSVLLLNSSEIGNTSFPETENFPSLPTSSNFTIGVDLNVNNGNYVAYLFAHETGDDSMIQCGSFSVNSSYEADVNLGFEPQWVLIKPAEDAASWMIFDTMRGAVVNGDAAWLAPDLSQQEASTANRFWPTATGFHIGNYGITAGNDIIYMAIRRDNQAEVTDATKVFAIQAQAGGYQVNRFASSGFPVDFVIDKEYDDPSNWVVYDRLRGGKADVRTNASNAESSNSPAPIGFGFNTGITEAFYNSSNNVILPMWKRAKGYFDVVAYTGSGGAGSHNHNLLATPEMIWFKARNNAQEWIVYHKDLSAGKHLRLNGTNAELTGELTTSFAVSNSQFTFANDFATTNSSSTNYIAYLFASLDGVSKVGSVSHSGSSTDVNCGFSNGARFVILKRTDATGDWYVWNSVSGIIAGNDPYLLLNTTAAQVTNTDYIDPLSSGFQISGDFTDGDYIFYAIA